MASGITQLVLLVAVAVVEVAVHDGHERAKREGVELELVAEDEEGRVGGGGAGDGTWYLVYGTSQVSSDKCDHTRLLLLVGVGDFSR